MASEASYAASVAPAGGAVPPVLRSRAELESRGVSFLAPGALAPADIPVTPDGTTYNMAQEAEWLDGDHFAVGRWDGTLSVFRFVVSQLHGPVVTVAASDPASEGVQMITSFGDSRFVTSAGDSALAVWTADEPGWTELSRSLFVYDASLGAANSGAYVKPFLAVGHAGGFVTAWRYDGASGALKLFSSIDVRNPNPVNPWNLHNVRGAAFMTPSVVVVGSEDGYISVITVPDGTILSQTVYNPSAKRGINTLSFRPSGLLLVGNCAVGPADHNLWGYVMVSGRPKPWSSLTLRVDPQRPQVFNFSTTWATYAGGACWFASTEEGALWMGGIGENDGLTVFGYRQVTSPLGSALAYRSGSLALVGHDLYEFSTGGADEPASDADGAP